MDGGPRLSRWVDCGIRGRARNGEEPQVQLGGDVRSFLGEVRFGVLATVNADGMPQQTVMWYELRGDTVMMNTLRGRRKDRNLLRDPRASLCVEDGQRYVTLAGQIEIVDDREVGQSDIHALAKRYEGDEAAAEIMETTFAKQDRVSLLLHIENIDAHGFSDEE